MDRRAPRGRWATVPAGCAAGGAGVFGRRHPLRGIQHGRAADAGAQRPAARASTIYPRSPAVATSAPASRGCARTCRRSLARSWATLPLADGTGTVLDWLRAHGRYLITGKGLSGWTLGREHPLGHAVQPVRAAAGFPAAIGLASGDWFEFSWPPQLHMPGAGAVSAHDGFMLVALAGSALLALYLLATLVFALSTVLPPLRQLSAGQYIRQRLGQLLGGGAACIGMGLLPVMAGIEETALPYCAMDFAEMSRATHLVVPLLPASCPCARPTSRARTPALSRCSAWCWCWRACSPRCITWRTTRTCSHTGVFMVWLALSMLCAGLRHQRDFDAQLLPQPARGSVHARSGERCGA